METIEEINESGIKFTMADLATRVAVSKSTLYAHFSSKEELIGEIVNYFLAGIRSYDEGIMNNDKLDFRGKLEALLLGEPKVLGLVSNRFILELRRHMPKEWEKKEQFRDQRWELIESLIKEGMNSGFIRSIDLVILKAIFNAAMDEFFSQKFLAQNNLTSADAIKKMANILYYGMVVPRCDER
ncbi:MAG: Bacterial regulatory protein, tetR family [Firmicutes bacterium]|nr:Bacterial regulatory protein, tetR family [Bacillota bacterium]